MTHKREYEDIIKTPSFQTIFIITALKYYPMQIIQLHENTSRGI